MPSYQDQTVFITGAAHGIGFSLAKLYAELNAKVIVCDVNKEHLKTAKSEAPKIHFYECNVADKKAVYTLAEKIIAEFGAPDILINNAGIVENSHFLNCSDENIEKVMQVNILSHFWTIKAFLPAMIAKGGGQVCEIASASGLMGVPGLVTYATSKHAVIGFAKSLQMEISELYPGKIAFTIVCPSFINTGLFKDVNAPLLTPILEQEQVANIIFEAVESKKELVMEPFLVKTIPLLNAVLPTKIFNSVTKLFKLHNSMDKILEKKSGN